MVACVTSNPRFCSSFFSNSNWSSARFGQFICKECFHDSSFSLSLTRPIPVLLIFFLFYLVSQGAFFSWLPSNSVFLPFCCIWSDDIMDRDLSMTAEAKTCIPISHHPLLPLITSLSFSTCVHCVYFIGYKASYERT